MTVTTKSFRDAFVEFTDQTRYTDPMVNFWGQIAGRMVNPRRWGSFTDLGVMLFMAHHLVLEKQAMDAAARGGDPGTRVGVMTNKAVGDVSVGYDSVTVSEKDGGHWNMTTYGSRYLRLLRTFGAGPVQIGVGPSFGAGLSAWGGPITMQILVGS